MKVHNVGFDSFFAESTHDDENDIRDDITRLEDQLDKLEDPKAPESWKRKIPGIEKQIDELKKQLKGRSKEFPMGKKQITGIGTGRINRKWSKNWDRGIQENLNEAGIRSGESYGDMIKRANSEPVGHGAIAGPQKHMISGAQKELNEFIEIINSAKQDAVEHVKDEIAENPELEECYEPFWEVFNDSIKQRLS